AACATRGRRTAPGTCTGRPGSRTAHSRTSAGTRRSTAGSAAMNSSEIRRPLEDMICELVDGLASLPDTAGVRVTSIELSLPVEPRVLSGPSGPVVHADMPALRTRTEFDLPVGRLVLRLAAAATEGQP